jgi:cell division protein FtsB
MHSDSEDRGLRAIDIVVWLFLLLGIVNFGWHAIQGEYGVFALIQAEADIRALEASLAEIEAERERMENLVSRLSPGYLDLDLLDERARAVLGYMRPDEATPR